MEAGLRAAMLQLDGPPCRTERVRGMTFYRECFGGELDVVAYPDASGTPNMDPKAPVQPSKIAQGGQALLMALDHPPGSDQSSQGENFFVFIDCSSNGEREEFVHSALARQQGHRTAKRHALWTVRHVRRLVWHVVDPKLCEGRLNKDGAPEPRK